MRPLYIFGIKVTVLCLVSMQELEASTYNRTCSSSDDCLGKEKCMIDFCDQSKCSCDVEHFYNGKTCERKKRYEEEECEYCYQCSTWLSVCDTTRDKPVCTCRQGHFFDEATDSCTNIEACPKDGNYIFSREDNVCYNINLNCANCTKWQDVCTENGTVPLHFVGNLREHFINRLWSYGFYSYQNALEISLNDEQAVIVLSTTYNYTSFAYDKPVWFWSDGEEILLDNIDVSEWTESDDDSTMKTGCLYMVYDACQSVFKASRQCNFEKSYRGCLIQLPNAYCYEDVDDRNTTWEYTEGGTVLTKACPSGYAGTVTRECTTPGDFKSPFYNCTLVLLRNITDLLESGNVSATEALTKVSSDVTQLEDLYIGDLLEVQHILETVVDLSENATISENSTNDFLETASFLLDHEKNGKEWKSRVENEEKGAEDILMTVENFVQRVAESLIKRNQSTLTVAKPNIVFQYAAVDTNNTDSEGISFPTDLQDSPEWNNTTTSSLYLDVSSFIDQGVNAFTCLLYRNLTKSVPQRLQGQTNTTKIEINSQVVSFQLLPEAPQILNPELELEFQGFKDMTANEQHCAYWTTDLSGNGFWSSEGCRKTFGNNRVVKCRCNHLTNFALLISPYRPPARDENILAIITIVGCSISGLFILITLVVHLAYWRLMKSDKTILVVCLCATFIVSYILFLGGVTQTSNKTACTAVAVALHYVFLVLFFLMLAEGITVFITVTFPFHRKSHMIKLLIAAFVIPLLIIATTAGVSKLDGYGSDNNCWLKPDTWLFWTFAGPACIVILANYITIGLFFRRLFGTKASHLKTLKEKAKMTAVAIGVLTPVMGLTWVFGIFSVNEDTLWLQYVFCVLNSFQGVLIFLFHCVGNKQLRQVMKASKERKRTVEEFNSELKEKIKLRFFRHLQHTTEESNFSTTSDNYSTDVNESRSDDKGNNPAKNEPGNPYFATGENSVNSEPEQRSADQPNEATGGSNIIATNADLHIDKRQYNGNDTECGQETSETVSPQLEIEGSGSNDDGITKIPDTPPSETADHEDSLDMMHNKYDSTKSDSNHVDQVGLTRNSDGHILDMMDNILDSSESSSNGIDYAESSLNLDDKQIYMNRNKLDTAESDPNGVDQVEISLNTLDVMQKNNMGSDTDDVELSRNSDEESSPILNDVEIPPAAYINPNFDTNDPLKADRSIECTVKSTVQQIASVDAIRSSSDLLDYAQSKPCSVDIETYPDQGLNQSDDTNIILMKVEEDESVI